jgi:hypothetical protein
MEMKTVILIALFVSALTHVAQIIVAVITAYKRAACVDPRKDKTQ